MGANRVFVYAVDIVRLRTDKSLHQMLVFWFPQLFKTLLATSEFFRGEVFGKSVCYFTAQHEEGE
jgi:hypothetical protein